MTPFLARTLFELREKARDIRILRALSLEHRPSRARSSALVERLEDLVVGPESRVLGQPLSEPASHHHQAVRPVELHDLFGADDVGRPGLAGQHRVQELASPRDRPLRELLED